MTLNYNTLEKRLTASLRARLWNVSKGAVRIKHIFPDLTSCPARWFIDCLTTCFKTGMTWDKFGKERGQWQVDHINQLSAWNLDNIEDVKTAFGWWNVRALWNFENWSRKKLLSGHTKTVSITPGNWQCTESGQLEFI